MPEDAAGNIAGPWGNIRGADCPQGGTGWRLRAALAGAAGNAPLGSRGTGVTRGGVVGGNG
jgi:hypothetical protein